MSLKIVTSILFVSVSCICASDFELETPDLLTQEYSQKSPPQRISKSKEFVDEDAIHKPDPLLQTISPKKKDKPTLLEKLLLQKQQKTVANPKEVFKKPLKQSDEIVTQDPLLDEI